MDRPLMVLDTESIGLHGPTFAYGYAVVEGHLYGRLLAKGFKYLDPKTLAGTPENHKWVEENCPWAFGKTPDPDPAENLGACRVGSPRELRDAFWQDYFFWRQQGALLAADCPWPVEANFLSACIADDPKLREWLGPYPMLDITTALFLKYHEVRNYERLDTETPAHHPLADALQSARLFLEVLPRGRA